MLFLVNTWENKKICYSNIKYDDDNNDVNDYIITSNNNNADET